VSFASATAEWRRFGDPRFRVYHYLAMAQGVVGVLVGFDVIIPWALAIGLPPFVAILLGVLPLAGGMAQLAVPRLLDRTDGNLRGLTIIFAALAEPRGIYFAALAGLVAAGMLQGPVVVILLAALVAASSALSSVVAANLLAWHSSVLPDADRRLLVPRLMALSMAVGALLLLPIAALLDSLVALVGLYAYALPFLVSGLIGVAEIFVLRRLRHPGRTVVPPRALAAEAEPTRELNRFLHVSMLNALGMGFAPAMSVFAISIVGLSAGFAMMLGAIGTLTMVVAAAVSGAQLTHGSSARILRRSFALRAVAMSAPLLALPGSVTAPVFLIAASILGAIGFASGSLAANERLFRLISGPAVIRHHARYLARTSGAMTVAQLAGAGIVAVSGPLGYPAFALLYAGSAAIRVVAYRRADDAPARQVATAEAGASAVA
jgi:MFS family permease